MVRRSALLVLWSLALAAPCLAQGLAPATVAPPPQTLPRNADRDGNLAAPGGPEGPAVAPDRPAAAPAAPEAPLLDPALGRLELIVEHPHPDTRVDEMVLVRLRGVYTVAIAIEEMKQPPLVNFGWQQLGRDSWTSAFIEGKKRTVFERRLALYPSRAGRLEIGPFTHRLTVADGGSREKRAVVSAPVSIEVAAIPPDALAQGWWLPASRLTYADEWDRDPSRLASGEVARRTVTIEAVGVPAARLPPRPKMLAEWLITFAEPEERTQAITPEGPVAKVVWRWRMRPVSSEPGLLEAFHIPWFDTETRTMRDVTLRSQRIALQGVLAEAPEPGIADRLSEHAPILAATAGFLLAGAALLPGRQRLDGAEWRRRVRRLPVSPDRLRLAAAIRRRDGLAARRIARGLLADEPADIGGSDGARAALGRLDAALFGRDGQPPGRALDELGRAMRRLR